MKTFDIHGFLQGIYKLLMVKPKKNSSQTFKKRGKNPFFNSDQENFKETDEKNCYTGGRKLRK